MAYLDWLVHAAATIQRTLPFDAGFTVVDKDGIIVKCIQPKTFTINGYAGKPVVPGGALDDCIKKRTESIKQFSKEVYGSPFLALGTPVYEDGKLVGAIASGINSETQVTLQHTAIAANSVKAIATLRDSMITTGQIDNLILGDNIVAESASMRQVLRLAYRVAAADSAVMLLGESGTGKEVVAKFIYRHSKRSKGPFVAINCAALPEHLIESELFGYKKGAFTGANNEGKIGLFEVANNGTLFLDEIAELPLLMQPKILRILETGEFRRLGDNINRKTDFRLIVATHRDLKKMVSEGTFRQDLYYRLNVVSILIPPLRERPEDIVMLARNFQEEFCLKYNVPYELDWGVLNLFLKYHWPGNIRELRNEVERRVIVGPREVIEDLVNDPVPPQNDLFKLLGISGKLKDVTPRFEEQYINSVVKSCNGRIGKAAEKLGISRMALYNRLKRANKFQ